MVGREGLPSGHHPESQLGIQDEVTIWVGSYEARAEGSGMAGLGEGHMGLRSSIGWIVWCLLSLSHGLGVGPGAVMSSWSALASLTHTVKCCVRERDLGLPARRPGAGRLGRMGAKRQP